MPSSLVLKKNLPGHACIVYCDDINTMYQLKENRCLYCMHYMHIYINIFDNTNTVLNTQTLTLHYIMNKS